MKERKEEREVEPPSLPASSAVVEVQQRRRRQVLDPVGSGAGRRPRRLVFFLSNPPPPSFCSCYVSFSLPAAGAVIAAPSPPHAVLPRASPATTSSSVGSQWEGGPRPNPASAEAMTEAEGELPKAIVDRAVAAWSRGGFGRWA